MGAVALFTQRFSRFRRWIGAYLRDAGPAALLRAVYRQALQDLLPFVRQGQIREDAWDRAEPERKGRALSAALFLADATSVPAAAQVARRLLRSVPPDEAVEYILAAQTAYPWRDDMPPVCFRCGRTGSWRPVFTPPPSLPAAYRWRYNLPENHIPLCHICADYALPDDPEVCRLWGRAVWGVRFDAWERLHDLFANGQIPRWDKSVSPLWPPSFGGQDWASGKGEFRARYPRPYSVRRLAPHREAARELLRRFPLRRRRDRSFLLRVAGLKGRRKRRQKR